MGQSRRHTTTIMSFHVVFNVVRHLIIYPMLHEPFPYKLPPIFYLFIRRNIRLVLLMMFYNLMCLLSSSIFNLDTPLSVNLFVGINLLVKIFMFSAFINICWRFPRVFLVYFLVAVKQRHAVNDVVAGVLVQPVEHF